MKRLKHWQMQRRSRAMAARCQQAALKAYLESYGELSIGKLSSTPLIAVDLELTGLDSATENIISMAWVLMDGGRIKLGSARHLLIKSQRSVGSSAAIHQITDTEIAAGVDLQHGLEALFSDAAGRVWLFHHAALDIAFLQKAWGELLELQPPFAVLDTMHMELSRRKRRDIPLKDGDLQLSQLRQHYHLPDYPAHDALVDALATAELLLAMTAAADEQLNSYIRYY